MAKKWIIESGELKLGNVGFHRDLAEHIGAVQGGGFWVWRSDEGLGTLYLYGLSSDFGPVDIDTVREVKENETYPPNLTGDWYFGTHHDFDKCKWERV